MDQVLQIGLDRVHPGRWQPRNREGMTEASLAELAADIKERGVLNPLLAMAMKQDGPIEVELIAGERRWRAARLAGLTSVPVRLVAGSEAELHEMAIVDNLQREDLTPLEEAEALKALQELHEYSQRQLASHVHKSQAWVQQRLALLEVSAKVQELVNTRVFSLAHARALSGLPEAVQEVVATGLDEEQERGVLLTSRQVEGVGKRIRRFLDPERFAGVEGEVMAPDDRNCMIVLRHLLATLPEEQLARAVAKLADGTAGDAALLARQKPKASDAQALIALLQDPEGWQGQYHTMGSSWWTDEVATATGRTCEQCIFHEVAAPKGAEDEPGLFCQRWSTEGTLVSCWNCLTAGDTSAIPVKSWYRIPDGFEIQEGPGYLRYVESPEVYVALMEALAKQDREMSENRESDRLGGNRKRLEAFRERCDAWAKAPEDALVDVDHMQAHCCWKCVHGWQGGECAYIQDPIGESWNRRPKFEAWFQVEMFRDNDDKPYKEVTRVVPRCEMFRYETLPPLHRTGWVTFSKDKRERRGTAMRWLRTMIKACVDQYGPEHGIWSPLRWLPYERAHKKHFDLDKMIKYVLSVWDEIGDAQVTTLLNAAASECDALRSRGALSVYNAATGEEERWLHVRWDGVEDPNKPSNWPDNVEWPFVKEQGDE